MSMWPVLVMFMGPDAMPVGDRVMHRSIMPAVRTRIGRRDRRQLWRDRSWHPFVPSRRERSPVRAPGSSSESGHAQAVHALASVKRTVGRNA
jgi:hypothetical protein